MGKREGEGERKKRKGKGRGGEGPSLSPSLFKGDSYVQKKQNLESSSVNLA